MMSVEESVVIQINIRSKTKIDVETLTDILSGKVDEDNHICCIHPLMTEVPMSCLQRLFEKYPNCHSVLCEYFQKMPESYRNECFQVLEKLKKRK